MHPPGESMGSIYRVRNLCQGLTALNHKCYIFTPFNYSEDWGALVEFIKVSVISEEREMNLSKLIYRVIRRILEIKIISNYTVLNPIIFNLTINRISKKLYRKISENSINLDVIIGETEIGGLILYRIKHLLNCPIIVDYQNFWPEELVEHKIIKRNSKTYKRFVEMEKMIIKGVNLVITPSKALRNFLIKAISRESESKIEVIINGGFPFLKHPKKKKGPPKIINAGMVVNRSNFKLFIESLPYVIEKYPNLEIYVTKKGEKLKELIKIAKKKKIKINFYWKDTYKEFLEFLSICDVGIVTSSYDLSRKLGFVTKIYDYFSVGIPIVGNDIGGWTSIIKNEKVGLLSTKDPKDLAEKLKFFIENPEISYEYGERAINLLKNKYNIKLSAQNLIECIEKVKNR